MFDVRKLANALLDASDLRGYPISNMALNKLAYFAHGWYLALYDKPLVDSRFEAWQFGPVHPQIYRQFKSFDDRAITSRALRLDLSTGAEVVVGYSFCEDISLHIGKIVEFYGHMPASRLSAISHEVGAPWDLVWNALGSSPGMALEDAVTRDYYRSKLKRPL